MLTKGECFQSLYLAFIDCLKTFDRITYSETFIESMLHNQDMDSTYIIKFIYNAY